MKNRTARYIDSRLGYSKEIHRNIRNAAEFFKDAKVLIQAGKFRGALMLLAALRGYSKSFKNRAADEFRRSDEFEKLINSPEGMKFAGTGQI